MFSRLAGQLAGRKHPAFDFAVVDEAQDVSVAQLCFLAALGANRPNGLFFAGDLGQRIFQQPFSWKSLGVDIRGRSRTLHINYRTSHQIRMQADQLLGPELSDVDRGAARHGLGIQRPGTCHSEVRQPGRGTQRGRRVADRTQQRGRDAP